MIYLKKFLRREIGVLQEVPEDTSEPVQNSDSEESPEVVPTPEAQDEEASDEAHDSSQQAS